MAKVVSGHQRRLAEKEKLVVSGHVHRCTGEKVWHTTCWYCIQNDKIDGVSEFGSTLLILGYDNDRNMKALVSDPGTLHFLRSYRKEKSCTPILCYQTYPVTPATLSLN